MKRADFLALAKRCENEEPSRELDVAILVGALGYRDVFGNGSLFYRGNDGPWTLEGDESNPPLPSPTFSVTAAKELEPADAIEICVRLYQSGAYVRITLKAGMPVYCESFAKPITEAMARCSAALRAMAETAPT